MATNILFVFEGRRTEKIITDRLFKYILNDNQIIRCVFEAEIYQLYKKLEEDEYLDIFNLIKNRNNDNQITLREYNRNDFAEIYLFFDYDAHATQADDGTLEKMLTLFDNETNNGKLYISYPMVESIRHIEDFESFRELTAMCKGANCQHIDYCEEKDECLNRPHYKTIVGNKSILRLKNMNSYTRETWMRLIAIHISKMNYIVNNEYEYPSKLESQLNIFINQFEKYINKRCPTVSVLSSFPIFVLDYYGIDGTKEIIYTLIHLEN